jgi:hypothetical protein
MARVCAATDDEPGREPESLSCNRPFGHDGPHFDPEDETHWEVTIT